jgi:Xaa-Pro aminopeptidase
MVTLSDRPHAAKDAANAALDAMIEGLRPGTSGRDMAALAEPHRGKMQWHPVLGDRIGYGVGLALEESPLRRDGADAAFADGAVFSLHAGFRDDSEAALASAILWLKDSRAEVLYRPRGER